MAQGNLPIGNPQYLVPHFVLYQNQLDASGRSVRKKIGSNTASLTSTNFGTSQIMGLDNVSIKYGLGYITCDVTFPIHQEMLINETEDGSGPLSQLFSIENTWDAEYGWSNDIGISNKITNMKLVKWGLNYDPNKRMFMGSFSLVPANGYILGDIKMLMLTGTTQKITEIMGNDSVIKKKGPVPISLGTVLTSIFEECRGIIQTYQNNKGSTGTTIVYVPTTGGTAQMTVEYSDLFKVARPEDIPSPDDVLLILFGDPEKTWIPDAVYESFLYGGIDNASMMDKITDESNKDLNVYQFINGLLDDNGFIFTPRAKTTDDGRIVWMILQSEFNNIEEIDDSEYKGINPNIETAPFQVPFIPGRSPNQTFMRRTFGKKKKNSTLFDLHSNKSIVLSVDASTDMGESTLYTYVAQQNLVDQSANSNGNPTDLTLNRYRNSLYKLLTTMSKEINLETLGFPEGCPFDSIIVKLAGKMFGGKYMITEITHKFANDFTTSIKAIRTAKGIGSSKSEADEPDVATADNESQTSTTSRAIASTLNFLNPDVLGIGEINAEDIEKIKRTILPETGTILRTDIRPTGSPWGSK